MSTQAVVSKGGQILAFLEFADWEGEPNREFTRAIAGDPTAKFGALPARDLRYVIARMFGDDATWTVSHGDAKQVSKTEVKL